MAFPKKITELAKIIGKAGVNALYPNDFEYYAITLELTDSVGNTIEYLTFPVSPESISYNNVTLVNIKKSMSGISALDNETFQPRKIEMTGTFGRKFKILLNNELSLPKVIDAEDNTAKGQFDAVRKNVMNVKKSVFNPKLKTGYGTTKILESIVEKSKGVDQFNRSYRLFLYNPALGHNWLVKINSINLSMDRTSSNMMWQYNMQLTAIAPLDRVKSTKKGTLILATGISSLQSGLNALASNLLDGIGNRG